MPTDSADQAQGLVERLESCTLRVGPSRWPFADAHAAEIGVYWRRRQAENPAMFDGTLFVLGDGRVDSGRFDGTLIRTSFKSLLYWKEHDYPDRSVRDVFGSALITSAEGHVVLGRQGAGNLNAGLAYLPGGFIDQRDVSADGHVDLEASVARELKEETGLSVDEVERLPGFLATHAGALTSIAVPYRSPLRSSELKARIHDHISRDPDPELSEAVVIRSAEDLKGLGMPIYASVLLAHLFPTK
jgi:ADP-ribose pyrophosphatase YjhB (NUDIX family)